MYDGWIKLHRSIKDNFLWKEKPFTKGQAWIDILIECNHSDGGFFCRGIWVDVKRGQDGRSELTLSNDWGWSRGKVRRFLKTLKTNGMITLKQDNKTTVLTVCNYEIYQSKKNNDDTTDSTPSDTPSDTPNGHQTDTKRYTNKNYKNVKNEEKEYSEDSKEFRLSVFLLNTIRQRKPDFKMPNLQVWSKQSDYILRIDRRDMHEIKRVVEWCQKDEFWQDNILSTAKLRKQYDQLVLKMNKIKNIPKNEPVSHPSHREL